MHRIFLTKNPNQLRTVRSPILISIGKIPLFSRACFVAIHIWGKQQIQCACVLIAANEVSGKSVLPAMSRILSHFYRIFHQTPVEFWKQHVNEQEGNVTVYGASLKTMLMTSEIFDKISRTFTVGIFLKRILMFSSKEGTESVLVLETVARTIFVMTSVDFFCRWDEEHGLCSLQVPSTWSPSLVFWQGLDVFVVCTIDAVTTCWVVGDYSGWFSLSEDWGPFVSVCTICFVDDADHPVR